jgi:hypothetical protein
MVAPEQMVLDERLNKRPVVQDVQDNGDAPGGCMQRHFSISLITDSVINETWANNIF